MTYTLALFLSMISFCIFCVMLMLARDDRYARRLVVACLGSGMLIVFNLLVVVISAQG